MCLPPLRDSLAPLINRARFFLLLLQLVSGTKTYLRPLSSAVISHSQYLQQNQIQTPVSLVSELPSLFSPFLPPSVHCITFRDQGYISGEETQRFSQGCLDNSLGHFRDLFRIFVSVEKKNI